MTSSIQSELRAYVWDAGEQPTEILTAEKPSDVDVSSLEQQLRHAMETKEFGRITRSYPVSAHVDAGEITLLYRAFTDQYRGRIIVAAIDEEDLDKSFKIQKKYCEQRVYSPAELYAMKPVSVHHFLYHLINVHLNDEVSPYDLDLDVVEAEKRIEVRELVNHDFDGRRVWMLRTIWFDGKPVMVVSASGRDADEYHDRWITDGNQYADMIRYLRSFTPQTQERGFVEASAKIPAMTEFYGSTIHDFYDVKQQEPRKK